MVAEAKETAPKGWRRYWKNDERFAIIVVVFLYGVWTAWSPKSDRSFIFRCVYTVIGLAFAMTMYKFFENMSNALQRHMEAAQREHNCKDLMTISEAVADIIKFIGATLPFIFFFVATPVFVFADTGADTLCL